MESKQWDWQTEEVRKSDGKMQLTQTKCVSNENRLCCWSCDFWQGNHALAFEDALLRRFDSSQAKGRHEDPCLFFTMLKATCLLSCLQMKTMSSEIS